MTLSAVVVLLMAQRSFTLVHLTPSARPGNIPQQHSVVWGPGVIATGLALLAVLSSLGWLIANWVSRPAVRLWWLFVGLVLVAGVWTAATSTMDTPKF